MKKIILMTWMIASATTVLAQQGPAPQGKPPTQEEEVATTSREMAADDTDKDGKISLKEFLVRPTDAFGKMDLNKDGQLTAEEFVTYRRQLVEANRKQMESMQKNMQSQPK